MGHLRYLTLLLLAGGLVWVNAAAGADAVQMRVLDQKTPQAQPIENPRVTPRGAAAPTRLPDLSITKLSAVPLVIRSGDTTTLTALVRNSGAVALHDVTVQFILSKTGRILGEDRIAIGAGQLKASTIAVPITGTGLVAIEALVDPLSRVKEADEKNNRAQSRVTVKVPTLAAPSVKGSVRQPQVPGKGASLVRGKVLLPKAVLQTGQEGGPQAPPGGAAWGVDFSYSLHLEQGVHPVNALNPMVLVKVHNNGIQNVPAFSVGLGKKGTAKMGKSASWLSIFQVPAGGIPSGQWIYAQLKLPPGIDEATNLVVAVDINEELEENNESNNYSQPFRVTFVEPAKPSLPAQTADLMVFPETTNGVYYGDGQGVSVLVKNMGRSDSPPCTIGIGFHDQVQKGGMIKWVGKATVPKIFSQQHVYVTVPGHFQVLPSESIYTVAVDIDDKVDEQGGEDNNLSKPFTYNLSSGSQATLPPQGQPFEAFDIQQPKSGKHLQAGSDLTVRWYPTAALNKLSADAQSSYWKIDISLVDPATGKIVALLAKNATNQPVSGLHTWTVTLPESIGDYQLRFSSPLGGGWGESGIFSLYKGAVAKAAVSAPDMAKGPKAITAQKVEKSNLSPAEVDAKALKFKLWRIKSITPKTVVLNGALGPYARLTSITVVVEYDANKPFKLTPSLKAPEDLKPDAVWSLAVPTILVQGCLAAAADINSINGSRAYSGCYEADPVTDQYPWATRFKIGNGPKLLKYPQGILPKGKNTLTLVMDEVGVAHGLKIVGKAEKMERYKKGVIIKHKWVYAKCTREFYPYFNVEIYLETYSGGKGPHLNSGQMVYGFKTPPVWQRLDPWANDYFDKNQTATGIPVYSPGMCQFE